MKKWKRKLIKHAIGACVVVLILVMGFAAVDYTLRNLCQERKVTATVKSITPYVEVWHDDGGYGLGSPTYYVATDKGMFKIEPEGLNGSSAFGYLEVGKTYNMTVRGHTFSSFKVLPFIITAKEK